MSVATLVAEVTAKAEDAYNAAVLSESIQPLADDDYGWEDPEAGYGLWSSYYTEEASPNGNVDYNWFYTEDEFSGSDTYFDYDDYEYQQAGY